MSKDIKSLKQIPLFKDLTEEEIHRVFSVADMIEIEKGKQLFEQGTEGNALYIIKSGQIGLKYKGKDTPEPVLVKILEPGETFGEMALIDSHPRSLSAYALNNAALLEIWRTKFMELLEKEQTIALKFYKTFSRILAKRLRESTAGSMIDRL